MKTRKVTIREVLLSGGIVLSSLCANPLFAQTDSTAAPVENKARGGATKFLLAGKAQMSWTQTQVQGNPASHTFFPDAFMLMPLVKINDRLFLDAQVEVDANPTGGGAAINLAELIVYYRVAPTVNIFAGNFSPKYGLYAGVLDDFTNRYCTDPIGMSRGPSSQTGIGIQGGIQAGYSKFSYQLYMANGPQLMVDSTTRGPGNQTGKLNYDNYADNNNNKSIGGSIGFLPLSNSNLQLDVSGQIAGKTGNMGTPLESVSSTSWAVDLNYYHMFNPIMVRVQAEYNQTMTKNQVYPWKDTSATSLLVPSFNNQFSGWYAGATIRAAGVNNKFLSNLELGGRIGAYTPPQYTGASVTPAPWGENPEQQTTVCLTYWFTWKTPLNLAYDVLKTKDGSTLTTYTARLIYFF
jgi:hypothetical protein